MPTFRIEVKREAYITYILEAKDSATAEDMARKHLQATYHLSDSIYDHDTDVETDSPFIFESDDDSQEELISVEAITK